MSIIGDVQHSRLAIMSGILALIVRSRYGDWLQVPCAATVTMSSMIEDNQELKYQVRRFVLQKNKNQFAFLIIYVDPKHFNRDDMIAIAVQLNRNYAQQTKLQAMLLDDDDVSRNIAPGGAEYSIFCKGSQRRVLRRPNEVQRIYSVFY